MRLKNNNGVTLLALVITLIVMAIIASIGVYLGIDSIKKANLETKRTDMLLIQGKAKEYVEEVNFRFGVKPDSLTEEQKNSIRTEVYETTGKMQKAEDAGITAPSAEECYYLTPEALEVMGLSKITLDNNEKYYVEFDEENIKVEVYSTTGIDGKYSLTELENIEL